MTDKASKLKPCPFCGGAAEILRYGTYRASCIIACSECGCRLEANEEGFNCGNAWSRRSPQPDAVAEAERALEEVEKWFQEIPPADWRVPTGLWDEVEAALAALRGKA